MSDNGIHAALVGLLRELPPPGSVFNKDEKQLFLVAFEKTLDLIYPDEPIITDQERE